MKSPEHSRELFLSQEIEEELELLAKKFKRTDTPLLTVDILADSREKFDIILNKIKAEFPDAEICQGQKNWNRAI